MDYDNLRRKLAGSKLSELYSEEAMIEHLFRGLSPSSQRSFPHGLTDLVKVINTLLEIAKLKGDMDGQEELPTALTNRRDNSKSGRCGRWGRFGHERKDCPNPLKCFNCQGTGHISRNCPKSKTDPKA